MYIYRCYTVYIVFIEGRRYAKGIILVNLCLNIYVRDVVAVFKLFAKAYSLMKNLYTTTISLRRRCAAVYTSLRSL